MAWDVEYTNEFGDWWVGLAEGEQENITAVVELLAEHGPGLRFPWSSGVTGSRHGHMRELRVKAAAGRYACSTPSTPRRTAVLLIGGDKTGDDRFYKQFVPLADRFYDEHLKELKEEGLIE